MTPTSPDTLRDLDSAEAPVRDYARARLTGIQSLAEWEQLLRSAIARAPGEAACAILNQEWLEYFERQRPPIRDWLHALSRLLVKGSPLLANRGALGGSLATVFENPYVSTTQRREFVQRVFAANGGVAGPPLLLRSMARLTRTLRIDGVRAELLAFLEPGVAPAPSPELMIDVLQALARVGRPEDIPAIARFLPDPSPGIAQAASESIVELATDYYALWTLLFDRGDRMKTINSMEAARLRDQMRSALVHCRFVLPKAVVLRVLAWVLRFEQGPRARASLIEVIARMGGATAAATLMRELRATRDRDEREKLRGALALVRTPEMRATRRVWEAAAASDDPFLQSLGWKRLSRAGRGVHSVFVEVRSRWGGLPPYSKLCFLEACRDIPGPEAKLFVAEVAEKEIPLIGGLALRILALREDVEVETLAPRLAPGFAPVLIGLSENAKVNQSRKLLELCRACLREESFADSDPELLYAAIRVLVRSARSDAAGGALDEALARAASLRGCLRQRVVELLRESMIQESLPPALIAPETFALTPVDALWREVFGRMQVGSWSERQWGELLLASRHSRAIRDFLGSQRRFWEAGVRPILGGFMSRERWASYRASVEGFAGALEPALYDAVSGWVASRDAGGGA